MYIPRFAATTIVGGLLSATSLPIPGPSSSPASDGTVLKNFQHSSQIQSPTLAQHIRRQSLAELVNAQRTDGLNWTLQPATNNQTYPCPDPYVDSRDGFDADDHSGNATFMRIMQYGQCNLTSSDGHMPSYIGPGNTSAGWMVAWPYGPGNTGYSVRIPEQFPLGGRQAGGWNRSYIFGSQTYGSGLNKSDSTETIRGVDGADLPFFFWPVVWTPDHITIPCNDTNTTANADDNDDAIETCYLNGTQPGPGYFYADDALGTASNPIRPGFAQMTTAFTSDPSSGGNSTTVRILSDNATTLALITAIAGNCSTYLSGETAGNQFVADFNPAATNYSMPRPEQAIQYYRGSSIALTLDGYNDTLALNDTNFLADPHTPLPDWIDHDFISCVNETIGAGALLVSSHRPLLQDMWQTLNTTNLTWMEDEMGAEARRADGLFWDPKHPTHRWGDTTEFNGTDGSTIAYSGAMLSLNNPLEYPIFATTLGMMFIVMKLVL